MKLFMLFAFGTLCAFPAFATGIPNDETNPSCDNSTLGTYSGSAALEPDWSANIIPIRWYNNNTLIQNPGANSTTCEYDGTLTTPTTAPTRTGYNFAGWKARPSMDFSTLTLSDGSEMWAVGTEVDHKYCYYSNISTVAYHRNCKTFPGYDDLELNEWKVLFASGSTMGTLYGSAYCSAKSGSDNGFEWNASESFSSYNQLESSTGEKNKCWCQVTGWKPSGTTMVYGQSLSTASALWVFNRNSTESTCRYDCAIYCAQSASRYSEFRAALFAQ